MISQQPDVYPKLLKKKKTTFDVATYFWKFIQKQLIFEIIYTCICFWCGYIFL